MSRSIGRAAIRLAAVAALIMALGVGVGSAQAEPGDKGKAPDSPGRSAQSNGQSDQDLNSPQPASNADFSGHGANTHGPYDSTRDGSPSLNGNGDGQAAGKPCAGCVGKADNKNPKGQLPGGSDANAGYECDRNSGVGKTNPAHTGCTEKPPTTTPPPPTEPPTEPPTTPPGKQPPGEQPPGTQPPGAQPPAGGEAPAAEDAELPVTGVDAWLPLAAGLALLGAGSVLLLAGRRFARR